MPNNNVLKTINLLPGFSLKINIYLKLSSDRVYIGILLLPQEKFNESFSHIVELLSLNNTFMTLKITYI
ncbi:hypothetical protein EGI16_07815 [Chryseobacterium sp. G0240]|nr:hypothetical protein EGI16_07815 [Chryseobacterium sp. G0240]